MYKSRTFEQRKAMHRTVLSEQGLHSCNDLSRYSEGWVGMAWGGSNRESGWLSCLVVIHRASHHCEPGFNSGLGQQVSMSLFTFLSRDKSKFINLSFMENNFNICILKSFEIAICASCNVPTRACFSGLFFSFWSFLKLPTGLLNKAKVQVLLTYQSQLRSILEEPGSQSEREERIGKI